MRWLRAGFVPASVLTLLAGALFVPLPIFVERPGTVVGLADCVEVDDEGATPVAGDYLLMTISVAPGSTVDALVAAVAPDAAVVPKGQFIPPGIDPATYFRRQRKAFETAADVAAAVGLQAAGFPTKVSGDGVSVTQTVAGTPAAEALIPGDIITQVNAEPVSMETDLVEAVAAVPVGDPLTLRVRRAGDEIDVTVTVVESDGRRIIGVVPETNNPRVELPLAVDVASGATGGPSAGLTIALTVYDRVLPGVDLAAGRTIAGTGSIDYSGRIGPIGGAGLKVLAAQRAGADLFLVPAENHAEAIAALPPDSDMEIVKVGTFEEARLALEAGAEQQAEAGEPAKPRPCPYEHA